MDAINSLATVACNEVNPDTVAMVAESIAYELELQANWLAIQEAISKEGL